MSVLRFSTKKVRFPAIVIGAALALASLTPPAAQAFEPVADKIFVVTVNHGSITDAIATQSASNSSYRARAAKIVSAWTKNVEAGKDLAVDGLKGQSSSHVLSELNVLQDRITRGISPGPSNVRPSAQPAPSYGSGVGHRSVGMTIPLAPVSAPTVVPAQIDPWDPNTFDVRGEPVGDRSYWTDLNTEMDGSQCGPSGCDLTDRYTVRTTVNPGTTISRLDHSVLYFPNSGNFTEAHFHQWAVNYGSVTNDGDTSSLPDGGSSTYLANNIDLSGSVLTVGLTLWVNAPVLGGWVYDAGKTADCVGQYSPDTRCFY